LASDKPSPPQLSDDGPQLLGTLFCFLTILGR
jgi:hypothetical protein